MIKSKAGGATTMNNSSNSAGAASSVSSPFKSVAASSSIASITSSLSPSKSTSSKSSKHSSPPNGKRKGRDEETEKEETEQKREKPTKLAAPPAVAPSSSSSPTKPSASPSKRSKLSSMNETAGEKKEKGPADAAPIAAATASVQEKSTLSAPLATTTKSVSSTSLPPLLDSSETVRLLALHADGEVSPSLAAKFVRRSTRDRTTTGSKQLTTMSLMPGVSAAKSSNAASVPYDQMRFGVNGQPSGGLLAALRTGFPALGRATLALNHSSQKGLCVTTRSRIEPGDFVIEYAGCLLTADEAEALEASYAEQEEESGEEVGCYMFYIKFKRKRLCIDATAPGPGKEAGARMDEHMNVRYYVRETDDSDKPVLAEIIPPSSPPSRTNSTSSSHSSSSSTSSSPSPPCIALPRRIESLGYGYARYINHSRTPNLSARIVDLPSKFIMTDVWCGSNKHRVNASSAVRVDEDHDGTDDLGSPKKHHTNGSSSSSSSTKKVDNSSKKRHSKETAAHDDDEDDEDADMKDAPTTDEEMEEEDEEKEERKDADSFSKSAAAPSSSTAISFDLHTSYPRLCFYANRPIACDEELTIDYGDRSKSSIADFPWLNS